MKEEYDPELYEDEEETEVDEIWKWQKKQCKKL